MRHARRLLALLLLIPVFAHSAASPIPDTSDLICHSETECYPKVFVPTDEFQPIHDDQEVPPGLHYRLNIYTGTKEAKLMAPGEEGGVVVGSHGEGAGTQEILGGEVAVQPNEIAVVPEEETKESLEAAEARALKVASHIHSPEQQAFTDLLLTLNQHAQVAEPLLLDTLSSLEDLAHSLDWGLELVTSQGLADVLTLIQTSSSPQVRSAAAIVLGSSLSNNPKAVSAVANNKPNIVKTLLERAKKETDEKVKGRLIYALDKAIKSDGGLSDFFKNKGITALASLASSAKNSDLVGRIAVFVDDNFLNNDMQAEEEDSKDKKKQRVSGLGAFCPSFREMLAKEEGQTGAKGKVMKTYLALRANGEDKCHETARDEEAEWVKTDL